MGLVSQSSKHTEKDKKKKSPLTAKLPHSKRLSKVTSQSSICALNEPKPKTKTSYDTNSVLSINRCEYVPEKDCSDGGFQPGRGNHPAGRDSVHQDVHQRPYDPRLLHRGSVLQRGHGGWTALHGTHFLTFHVTFLYNVNTCIPAFSQGQHKQPELCRVERHVEIISVALRSRCWWWNTGSVLHPFMLREWWWTWIPTGNEKCLTLSSSYDETRKLHRI